MIDPASDQPAFPRSYSSDGHNGMSLRDYFAAQVAPEFIRLLYMIPDRLRCDEDTANVAAVKAYAMADAMLKARAAVSAPGERGK